VVTLTLLLYTSQQIHCIEDYVGEQYIKMWQISRDGIEGNGNGDSPTMLSLSIQYSIKGDGDGNINILISC